MGSQFQTKKSLEFAICGADHTRVPSCQLCGRPSKILHLHHIINRSYIPHKKINDLPIVFHALICPDCHLHGLMGSIDTPDMRAKLIAKNAEIFGMDRVEQSFKELNDMLPNGLNPAIVSIDKVKEYYNE